MEDIETVVSAHYAERSRLPWHRDASRSTNGAEALGLYEGSSMFYRCQDGATASRDAIDLGMLALHCGPFPEAARQKAEHAYGDDVALKLVWVLAHLGDPAVRRRACETSGMEPRLFNAAAQENPRTQQQT